MRMNERQTRSRRRSRICIALSTTAAFLAIAATQAQASFLGWPTVIAYVEPTGNLMVYIPPAFAGEAGITENPHVGVEPGTNPSIASTEPYGRFYQATFSAAGESGVWLDENNVPRNEHLGMAKHTSPSMATYAFAFQANTGALWVDHTNTTLGMMAGTSPSVTPKGVAAFQANTGQLWVYVPGYGGINTSQGMAPGTSPAIGETAGGGWIVAFHALGSNHLITWNSAGQGVDTGLGVENGTSPSIASEGNGFTVAFEGAGSKELWTYDYTGAAINRHAAMLGGTSPSIAARYSNGVEVAFHGAKENRLETWSPLTGTVLTGKTLRSDDSPSIGS